MHIRGLILKNKLNQVIEGLVFNAQLTAAG